MSRSDPGTLRKRAPVSVVVLTYDEESNLNACLASVCDWAEEVFVVDSGSTDGTVAVAKRHGAKVVTHPFESHARQWNWALQNLPISTDWILAFDADQRATPELAREICKVLGEDAGKRQGGGQPDEVNGFYIKRRQIFRGRWIKRGDYYPKYLLKLFRRGQAWSDEEELADHRFYVAGECPRLNSDLMEDNRKEWDILMWMEKHVIYAGRQAEEEFRRRLEGTGWSVRPSLFGSPNQRSLWRKRLYYRMPLYIRPFLYFFYRYFLRLGFLDGKEGFIFHFFQAFWYRLLVDIKLEELRRQEQRERESGLRADVMR